MQVTIDLTDAEVRCISNWASLGRTLTAIRAAMDGDATMYDVASEELECLHVPLESLFHKTRDKIWAHNRPAQEKLVDAYSAGHMTDEEWIMTKQSLVASELELCERF
jgi:hypothetical protein